MALLLRAPSLLHGAAARRAKVGVNRPAHVRAVLVGPPAPMQVVAGDQRGKLNRIVGGQKALLRS